MAKKWNNACRARTGRFAPCAGKPAAKLCFTTKAALTKEFIAANAHVLEKECETDSTGDSFDAINHEQDRRGRRKVKDCTAAVKAAIPAGRPFCLDKIDLELLNRLPAAQRAGGFRLPPAAQAIVTEREAREHYSEDRPDDGIPFDIPGDSRSADQDGYRADFEGTRRRRRR